MKKSQRLIEYFKPRSARTLLSATEANKLAWLANALFNAEVKTGDSNAIFFSDSNIIIQVRNTGEPGPTGEPGQGDMSYRGEWASSPVTAYEQHDVVRVSTSSGSRLAGVYVYVGTSPSNDSPEWPEPVSPDWHLLSLLPSERIYCDDENGEVTVWADAQDAPPPD